MFPGRRAVFQPAVTTHSYQTANPQQKILTLQHVANIFCLRSFTDFYWKFFLFSFGYFVIATFRSSGNNQDQENCMNKIVLLPFFIFLFAFPRSQQMQINLSADRIEFYTPCWKGERFPDGRPKVADKLLERLKNISMEDAWGYLRNKGFQNQYEGDWQILRPDSVMIDRVVTAQYMPLRPNADSLIRKQGKNEGRIGGANSWPVDVLKDGDLYVAGSYGKIVDGTLIGDNLGNSIYTHSHKGVIFYGSARNVEGLEEINGFNAWVKGSDPSYLTAPGLGVELNEEVVKRHLHPDDKSSFAPTTEWNQLRSHDRVFS